LFHGVEEGDEGTEHGGGGGGAEEGLGGALDDNLIEGLIGVWNKCGDLIRKCTGRERERGGGGVQYKICSDAIGSDRSYS
jgi:hypothetical protein